MLNISNGIDQFTQLLLPLNDNLDDLSQNNFVVVNNQVTFGNTNPNPQFTGTYYGVFGATSALSIAPASPLVFGTNDWTIDFWVYLTNESSQFNFTSQDDNLNGFEAFVSSYNNQIEFLYSYNNAVLVEFKCPNVLTTGQWHHVVYSRYGNTPLVFVDGILQTLTITHDFTGVNMQSIPDNFVIGADPTLPAPSFNGYIQEFRVSVGVARWTANFIPPIAPYTASVVVSPNSGSLILPLKPVQGQAFSLSVDSTINTNQPYTAKISKNGGAFVASINPPTFLADTSNTKVCISLNLTASEMASPVIWIDILDSTGADFLTIVVNTTTNKGFSLSTIIPDIKIISSQNPTLDEVLSLVWQALTKAPGQKGGKCSDYLNGFDF